MSSRNVWIITGGSVAVLGAAAWGLSVSLAKAKDPNAVPKEYSVAALESQLGEPGKMMDNMRATMDRTDLTDEQRKQIGQNMRKVMENTMRKRMDEYFKAQSEEEKNAVLDRQIDEFQSFMKEMEKRREEAEKARKEGKDPDENARKMFGQQSQSERKTQSESRNPDDMAKSMAYYSAMGKRMQERGIKMPGGGRGGFFGRGGGGGGGPRRGGP